MRADGDNFQNNKPPDTGGPSKPPSNRSSDIPFDDRLHGRKKAKELQEELGSLHTSPDVITEKSREKKSTQIEKYLDSRIEKILSGNPNELKKSSQQLGRDIVYYALANPWSTSIISGILIPQYNGSIDPQNGFAENLKEIYANLIWSFMQAGDDDLHRLFCENLEENRSLSELINDQKKYQIVSKNDLAKIFNVYTSSISHTQDLEDDQRFLHNLKLAKDLPNYEFLKGVNQEQLNTLIENLDEEVTKYKKLNSNQEDYEWFSSNLMTGYLAEPDLELESSKSYKNINNLISLINSHLKIDNAIIANKLDEGELDTKDIETAFNNWSYAHKHLEVLEELDMDLSVVMDPDYFQDFLILVQSIADINEKAREEYSKLLKDFLEEHYQSIDLHESSILEKALKTLKEIDKDGYEEIIFEKLESEENLPIRLADYFTRNALILDELKVDSIIKEDLKAGNKSNTLFGIFSVAQRLINKNLHEQKLDLRNEMIQDGTSLKEKQNKVRKFTDKLFGKGMVKVPQNLKINYQLDRNFYEAFLPLERLLRSDGVEIQDIINSLSWHTEFDKDNEEIEIFDEYRALEVIAHQFDFDNPEKDLGSDHGLNKLIEFLIKNPDQYNSKTLLEDGRCLALIDFCKQQYAKALEKEKSEPDNKPKDGNNNKNIK